MTAGQVRAWARRTRPGSSRLRPRWVVAVALTAVAAVAGAGLVLHRLHAVPPGAVLRVGSVVVTEQRFAERMTLLTVLYGVMPPTDPAGTDAYRRDGAESFAVSIVLDRAAHRRGIVIPPATAAEQLDELVTKSFPPGPDEFTRRLASVGVSRADVLAEVSRGLADARLYELVTRDVAGPTDQQVAAEYRAHPADMAVPQSRHLRNIVVATESEAAGLRARLASGADFAAEAARLSLDQGTRTSGGDLGTVVPAQLERGYGAAAFGAPVNGLYGPVRTADGWNVGQVLQILPAVPLSLDRIRERLRADLFEQRKRDAWSTWLSGRLASARVRYADAYRPTDPDRPPPDPGRAPTN